MSSLSRLRGIFSKNPFVKPKTQSITSKPKSAPASKNALKTQPSLEEMVDNFKKKCAESARFRVNARSYDVLVRRLINAKQFSMIEDILESQKKFATSEGFVIRLIMLYGKAGMFNHARKMFDEMPEFKCERTVKAFNALLSAFVNAKVYDKVEGLFRELPSQLSLEVNLISYNIVIHALCQTGSFDSALAMLDEMNANGLEPDLVTFNTLLGACYKNERYAEGDKIWAMMESQNITPNVRSYNLKIGRIVCENSTTEAVKVIDEMKQRRITPDKITFHELIKGFCSEGKLDEAKNCYNQLQELNCLPDKYINMTLLPFICEMGDCGTAMEICSKEINDRSLINVDVLKRVVDALLAQRKFDKAMELIELGKSRKFKIELPLGI